MLLAELVLVSVELSVPVEAVPVLPPPLFQFPHGVSPPLSPLAMPAEAMSLLGFAVSQPLSLVPQPSSPLQVVVLA